MLEATPVVAVSEMLRWRINLLKKTTISPSIRVSILESGIPILKIIPHHRQSTISIKDNYQTASLVVPFLLMIIVGTKSFHISIYDGNKFVNVEPEVV